MNALILIIILYCGFVSCDFQRGQFVNDIFANYDSTYPPRENLSESLTVTIDIKILSVDFVSEIDQYLKATLRMKISWKDNFIKWNSSCEKTPDFIHLPSEKLWTPRILVKNSVNDEFYLMNNENLIVFADGLIMSSALVHTKTSCKINIAKFPFDQQICTVIISPSYRKYSYFILNFNDNVRSTEGFKESTEWHLTETRIYKDFYFNSFYGELEKGDIVFEVVLERRYVFHIFKGILPPVCLSLMNCFVFRLPAADGERITMSISVLLSYTLYLSFINESLPENSDTICIFSVYLSCLLILSTLIILATIYSIILHQNVEIRNGQTMVEEIDKGQEGCADEKPSKFRWIKNAKMYDKTVFQIFMGSTIIVATTCIALMLN